MSKLTRIIGSKRVRRIALAVGLLLPFALCVAAVVARWDSYEPAYRIWVCRVYGFSSDGSRMLSGDRHAIQVWDVPSGTKLLHLEPKAPISHASLSNDGRRLVLACVQGRYSDNPDKVWPASVYVHDAVTGELTFHRTLGMDRAAKHSVFARAFFSHDDKKLIYTTTYEYEDEGESSVTVVYAMEPYGHGLRREGVTEPQLLSREPEILLVVSDDKAWKLDLQSCSIVGEVTLHPAGERDYWTAVYSCVSPDARRLVVGGRKPGLYEYDLESGEMTRMLPCHPDALCALEGEYSPDGRTILFVQEAPVNQILDAATGRVLYELSNGPFCWFSPSGARLIAPGENGDVSVLDSYSGDVLRNFSREELEGFTGAYHRWMFSPGDEYLVGVDSPFGCYAHVFRRTRPEQWWGHLCRLEVWGMIAFAGLWLWSVVRCVRGVRERHRPGPAEAT